MRAFLKYPLAVVLVLFAGIRAEAQQTGEVRGKVLAARTGEPVVAASVWVSGAGREKHVRSNVEGRFVLPRLSANDTLHVRSLGYRDTAISLAGIDSITVALNEAGGAGQEITVTALRHVTALQDVPITTVAMSGAEIERRNPQGIDNALRYLPGVTIAEDQLSIRGSSGYSRSVGARVLLLMDGMPFLSADNSDMKFDAVPLMSVERVEVVKGAGSALYGSSALGGVINVITRQPTSEPRTDLKFYSGFYDEPIYAAWRVPEIGRRFWSGEAGTSGTLDGTGYLVSGSYKRNEGYRFGDDTYRWNAFGKVERALGASDKLTLSLLGASENHGGWLYWRGLSDPLMASDSLGAVNGRIHSSKLNALAAWNSYPSEYVVSSLKLSDFYTSFTTDPSQPGGAAGAHSKANGLSGDYSITWTPSGSLAATLGASATRQTVSSDLFQDHSGVLAGSFAQVEYRPTAALTLTPGLRWDYIRYSGVDAVGQLSPKIGASWQAMKALALRASYGSGFRAPSISERFINSTLDGFQVRPNLDLKPERSQSGEVGLNWSSDLVTFDAAGFYSTFRDLIEAGFVTTPDGSAYIQFRNVTQALIAGHEESVVFHPFSPITIRAAYTYIYPENTETHEILAFRPRHVAVASVEYAAGALTLSSDLRFVSRYETTDSTLSVQIPSGDARVSAYVLDARASYDLTSTGLPLILGFQVQNLLNYYYVEIAGNLAPLRNFSMSLEAKF